MAAPPLIVLMYRLWFYLYGVPYVKKAFTLQVHSLVDYYGWYNLYKNGFMVYS